MRQYIDIDIQTDVRPELIDMPTQTICQNIDTPIQTDDTTALTEMNEQISI